MPKRSTSPLKLESIRHKDKRTNIPTEELRDFVADEELAPKTMLYPRDASLDPQLVWKGKDEQDRQDLAVPVVPIYIQEKIHPQAIIDAFPRKEPTEAVLPNLFADFNGGPQDFEQKVDFYHHEQNWTNRLILGDSLLVMTSLAEKEGLKGKVQTIYVDPPYGIRFGSNWQVSTRKREVKDGRAEDATRQPEQVRAFRDTWKLGIHSYLAYLRDRLVVARELLTETGSVFVQIGDENVHLVRNVLDEIFGSENFLSLISFSKAAGGLQSANRVGAVLDYIVWYAKDAERVKYRSIYETKTDAVSAGYTRLELLDGTRRSMTPEERATGDIPEGSRPYMTVLMTKPGPGSKFEVKHNGRTYDSGNRWWGTTPEGIQSVITANRVEATDNSIRFITYFTDFPCRAMTNLWSGFGGAANPIYVVQTNAEIVKRCLLMTTDPGDLVFDPTCGSGTTAFVAEQWGRRWITCDTSRVALALARTRMMGARYPYYSLADSPDGVKKESEVTGKVPPEYKTADDIRKGFVYKRLPHVTFASIANNPDIKKGMTRAQIDAAVAQHTESELLFDQPYEDNRRIRVCGPFSVESLSPHRVLSIDEGETSTGTQREAYREQDFAAMILENLKKAGIQNARKAERLTFDRLDPYAGLWLNAAGEYTTAEGKTRRVAVSIGPEHGTVGPQQVKEAAKEAVQGVGFDMLVVCGFAFDPHVAEEVKRYGKLTVLPTKMNPDLAMGDELLKKTGAGNLFMVFGEPDVELKKAKAGQFTIEIKGLDVYDPTTGQIRSASTDDIACWFIDTDYNGESFFVRHAYFTGADEPYDRLKRALKAEIDEEAWSSLYSTVSRPFDKPESGKIAVKVINHYGDEVLKVFNLSR
jgi:adenine-specific DNA-methyltransferase